MRLEILQLQAIYLKGEAIKPFVDVSPRPIFVFRSRVNYERMAKSESIAKGRGAAGASSAQQVQGTQPPAAKELFELWS